MRRAAALGLALLVALTGCAGVKEPQHTTLFAMDTVMDLQFQGRQETLTEAVDLIHALEAALSVTAEDSDIANLNTSGSAQVGPDTAELISRALELCALTDGALDITVYPAVRAWGFTTGDYRVPDEAELSALAAKVDYTGVTLDGNTVTLPEGAMLDLGGVAKGFTGDKLAALLRSVGVESALLNLGGNVHAVGSKPDGSPWRVGIRDPFSGGTLGALTVTDAAVVTSGGYERYFEQDGVTYWHILDPDTCRPARSGLMSVTVTGPEGTLCDGLSTALFVMGLDRASELWRQSDDFEAVFVTDSQEVYITEGLETSFSLLAGFEDLEVRVIRRG